MKASKIASIVYYVLIALSVVVLALFFTVGFGNMESLPSGYYRSPAMTDLLMYFMYGLMAICTICTVAGAVTAKGGKVDSNMPKWGKLMASIGLWLFVPALVVSFVIGSKEPVLTGTGIYENAMWLQVTDMMMYTIYALLVAMVVGLIISLTGIFKK